MTSAEASALHQAAIVVDAHCDILIPITDGICRLGERAQIPRPEEWRGLPGFRADQRPTPYQHSDYAWWFTCAGQYDIPSFKAGGVTAQVTAAYISDKYLSRPVERALAMIAALHREIAANPHDLLLIEKTDDILLAKREGKTGLLLAFEGAEPLGPDLKLLEAYHALGLRMVGLTHSRRNLWADGTQTDTETGGLTNQGRELIRKLNQLGIIIDLAHLNDLGFWQVLELSATPPILSHTSLIRSDVGYRAPLTAIHPTRNVSKMRALAARGGVAGLIFWNYPSVDAIVDDIMSLIEHAGEDHVGLASDFFSVEAVPPGLEDISGLPRVTEALLARGLSDTVVLKILGNNWLRIFREIIN
jgi:membrane dipeptidase